MARYETGTTIEFGRREAITLNDVRGAILRVKRGTVWITQEREPQDIVLRDGDSWVVEANGATVLEAQDAATVQVVGCAVKIPKPQHDRGSLVQSLAQLLNPWMAAPRQVPYY